MSKKIIRKPKRVETEKRKPGSAASGLLAAACVWRHAEIHHAAITLELRDGDLLLAKAKLDEATRQLRIATDNYYKSANAAAERPGGDDRKDNYGQ